MGFFGKLFGVSQEENKNEGIGRYVSEADFQSNLQRQTTMAPQTLEQLRGYGVTSESLLKLEFFFYTNSAEKASAMATKLGQLRYDVSAQQPDPNENLYVITGWTIPMLMDESTVESWTGEMCRCGFQHDCEFDGWGTNPEQ